VSLLLGIDVGTSGLKAVVYDAEEASPVAFASGEYPLEFPFRGAVEQDARLWWKATVAALSSLKQKLAERGRNLGEIRAVGVGGQGWSCLPVDEKGEPLRPSMIWLDRRAEEECDYLRREFGDNAILEISGNRIDPAYVTPKQLWLKKHQPQIFRKARYFLQSESYIVFKLTGRFTQNLSSGYGFYFFDIARGEWRADIAERMGIPIEKHPEIYDCSEVVGEVTTESAEETGLRRGTPVVAGGLDAACATLGAGVYLRGQTQDQGGTAGGMSICVDEPLRHPDLILGFHVVPRMWLLQGGTVAGGASLNWFRDTFGVSPDLKSQNPDADDFELLSMEAAESEAGSGGVIFLPYLAGERSPLWDSAACGVFFGLSFTTKRCQIVRAVMEGAAFALRHNLETAATVGAEVTELYGVGGATRSEVWCQIKSDITGKPMHIPSISEGTTLGAAILAGKGVGVFREIADGVRLMVKRSRSHLPRAELKSIYDRLYGIYLKLYPALRESMHSLRSVTVEGGSA